MIINKRDKKMIIKRGDVLTCSHLLAEKCTLKTDNQNSTQKYFQRKNEYWKWTIHSKIFMIILAYTFLVHLRKNEYWKRAISKILIRILITFLAIHRECLWARKGQERAQNELKTGHKQCFKTMKNFCRVVAAMNNQN